MIIAIESASTDPSLALAEPGDGEPSSSRRLGGGHGQGRELLPRLLALLWTAGRPVGSATAVAVGIGPGSFTGLRVGMSLAKGLAFGLAVPILGIPSLEGWLAAEPDARAAIARAGAHDAFVLVRGAAEPVVVSQEALPAGAYADPVVAPSELAAAFDLRGARTPAHAAAAVARLAADRLRSDPAGDELRTPGASLPAPSPWRGGAVG